MNSEKETKNLSVVHRLLSEAGMNDSHGSGLNVHPLTGDGSSRKFWRITDGERSLCLAVAPPSPDAQGLAEARSARAIGLHLLEKGVSVPEQYGWDEETGVLLFQDLGDEKLHDSVLQAKEGAQWQNQVLPIYSKVVQGLAVMQTSAAKGFDDNWCWDSKRYDKELMLERESGYFLRAFWHNYLGQEKPSGIEEEFSYVAERASLIPADYFLHRDFQSRNIMLYQDVPCFIDFQGGRLGPLAYDLASLLIDPYAALPFEFQEELLGIYLDALERVEDVDRRRFVEEYLLLALQRNLQIVGAFSFLSRERGKMFFEQFLQPAMVSLQTLLECEVFAELAVLKEMAARGTGLLYR
jgi:aminoglycoside/choline kinase family phosphotransferase